MSDYRASAPQLVGGLGAALFLVAVTHHATELTVLDGDVGPLLAFALDGALALWIVAAGLQLSKTDLAADGRWTTWRWSLGGAVLIGATMGLTIVIRLVEGRTIAEPIFPLLVATEVGAIAGFVAGFNNARARADARRAETVSDAFGFVNSLTRHDLRNDLTVIRGYAECMVTDDESRPVGTDPETPSIIVEKSDEALTRIGTTEAIADTLLGDAGREPVDLAAIAAEMATRVEATLEVTVTTDLPDEALVTGNAGLRSVVDNLLENAAEHNDAADPRVHVDVTVDGDVVRLLVRDNGPGIPDDRVDGVFEPGAGGQGGLSLVGTLVAEYDGDIRISDNDPRGTVFTVELPRADPDTERDPIAADTVPDSR